MSWYHPRSLLDAFFEGGVIIKGATGLVEFTAGALLFFVKPAKMHHIVAVLTRRELIEDPDNRVANLLVSATSHFSNAGEAYLIAYLWIHAAINIVAAIGLLRNLMWAYPFSLVSLGLFIVYQLYTIFFVHPTFGMILVTSFDLFIFWLIWREYHRVKNAKTRHHVDTSDETGSPEAK